MFSKNKTTTIVYILLSVLLVSCSFVKKDPVKKYNSAFLDKNASRIERPRKKHEKLVNQVREESHRKNYPGKSNAGASNFMKTVKTYKNEGIPMEKNDTIQVGSNLSIYYRESRLKDRATDLDNFLLGNKNNSQIYLSNNYLDYSEEKINFKNIKPTAKGLYGELKLRREEERAIPSNLDFLKCFDYIDLMDRTKKEMYLKSKEEKITDPDGGKNAGKVLINTTKEKILKIFRGNSKTKATGTETTK